MMGGRGGMTGGLEVERVEDLSAGGIVKFIVATTAKEVK